MRASVNFQNVFGYIFSLPVIIPYLNLFPVSDIPWVCEAAYVWSLWVTTDPSGHTLSSAVFVEICHRWKVSVFVKYHNWSIGRSFHC